MCTILKSNCAMLCKKTWICFLVAINMQSCCCPILLEMNVAWTMAFVEFNINWQSNWICNRVIFCGKTSKKMTILLEMDQENGCVNVYNEKNGTRISVRACSRLGRCLKCKFWASLHFCVSMPVCDWGMIDLIDGKESGNFQVTVIWI